MPSGAELKVISSLDACFIGFFSERAVNLLRGVCVCAAVCPCLSLHHTDVPKAFCVSVWPIVYMLQFLSVCDLRCLCASLSGCEGVFMDPSPWAGNIIFSCLLDEGMSQSVDCLSQSSCPLVCEVFIIELAQALWPYVGGMLSSNATLLAHYLWKEVTKNCIWMCVYLFKLSRCGMKICALAFKFIHFPSLSPGCPALLLYHMWCVCMCVMGLAGC